MKKTIAVLALFLVTVCSAWAIEGSDSKLYGISQYTREKHQVIVRFRSEKAMGRLEKTFPGSIRHRYHRFPMAIAELTGREAAALARDRDVLSIETDSTYQLLYIGGVVPTHEYQSYGLARMGITQAFHEKGYLGQGVKVGIIDTGVASGHPDLHVPGGADFTWSPTGLIYYEDVMGHGTHVAGIIGARRNGIGVVGVAPEAELYSLQCFNLFGQAAVSSIINCIQWAIDHQLDILNMSFGGPQNSPALKEACQRAYDSGILLVAAAGNSGRGEDTVSYPAKFDTVIAVSATDENDRIADFSSRGPAVEVAAPGVNILSTITYPMYYELSYDYLSGTSMACPQVVGMAALIKSANPGISQQEIRRRLQLFAKDLGPAGRDNDYGYGILRPERDPSVLPDQSNPLASAGGLYRGVVGEPVEFSVHGTLDQDDNFLSYKWGFSDGETAQGQSPSHVYDRPGSYVATLTVTDQDGRKGRATAEVQIDAGVPQSETLGASDTGYAKEPSSVYLHNVIRAGTSSGMTHYGLIKFNAPSREDIRVLSAELVLTVITLSPKDEGIITAGLFAPEIAQKWPSITYTDVDQAEVIQLDFPIFMSYLHTGVAKGLENRFSVPVAELAAFEEQFKRGSVAFRMALDSGLSNNRLDWANPKLVVRYLEGVSQGSMPPIARAGHDRRALSGSRVMLDGSASTDWEGTPLSYHWVQKSGKTVTLSANDSPIVEFTAPSGNDVLVFELKVNDNIFESSDEVKIFLNSAPAEIKRIVLVPAFGNAGYVEEDHPTVNFFDKREILVGSLFREYQGTVGMSDGQATAVGAMRFDLSEIPAGSQVVSATLEITGKSRWTDHRSKFVIKVLTPEIDDQWDTLDYPTLTNAGVVSTLSPTLNALMVKRDAVNKVKVSPEILEARRDSSNKITLRIDGPDKRVWADNTFFSWWSGNEEQTAVWGPRLIIEYGAIKAEEAPVPPSQ